MYTRVFSRSCHACFKARSMNTMARVKSVSQAKDRLQQAVRSGKNLAREEVKEKKHLKFLHKKNLRPVRNNSAIALLEDLLQKKFPADTKVGPLTALTDEELNIIFNQPNKRLKYKILGTSGNQLQNSVLVDRDVTKYLQRGDLTRAVLLAEMAGENGIFAVGTILKSLLAHQRFNKALLLFNRLKKRSIKPDGRVLNIMFSGLTRNHSLPEHVSQPSLSSEQASKLYSIFSLALRKTPDELSVIHVNSLLKAFRTANRPDLAIMLFDKAGSTKLKALRPDLRTYTEMFSNLRSYTDDFRTAVKTTETLFARVQRNPAIKIDSKLIRSYSSVFVFANDTRLCARAITILRDWYKLCKKEDIGQIINASEYDESLLHKGNRKISEDVNVERDILLPRNEINLKKHKRFEVDQTILRRYQSLCDLFKLQNSYVSRESKSFKGHL
ncbi:DEBR0S4_14026g1_1 [Brettanomyces bruxellensis]|uniref:Mitochondrial 15S rRNA processing factor CCM1 n=1 Tax=Dekkera bruxellensis TaxID=5007 RepID=A0A7D9H605_DEKBR|nr:DEBR0S4_14026g1_1 [Brettanomyces bruxellensis]